MLFPPQELFIKVCGITNLVDAQLACSLGANAVGFNFTETNERFITPELAKSISGKLPDHISKIGVFENVEQRYISYILKRVQLSAIQLFGNYGPDDLIGYETSVIKVFMLDNLFDVEVMKNYIVSAFLFKVKSDDKIGLKPREYHWDTAVKAKEFGRVILSNQLTPDNVEDAVKFVRPFGVDVCEGVEVETGKKDASKMRNFISRARNEALFLDYDDKLDDESI